MSDNCEILVKNERKIAVRSYKHIVLVGVMGVGKSTVAPLLAQELYWPSCDTDIEIAKCEGVSGGDIIRKCGIQIFRQIEEKIALSVIASETKFIVATGAGVYLSARFRSHCWHHLVIWLRCEQDILSERIRNSDRYLARIKSPRLLVHEQVKERYDLYTQSDIWVECNTSSAATIANLLAQCLGV